MNRWEDGLKNDGFVYLLGLPLLSESLFCFWFADPKYLSESGFFRIEGIVTYYLGVWLSTIFVFLNQYY